MAARIIKNKKSSVILAVLFFALVIYFVATLISSNSEVRAQEAQINELKQTYQQQLEDNKAIEEQIENGEEAEIIERIAREEYDYADSDERVYYDSTLS